MDGPQARWAGCRKAVNARRGVRTWARGLYTLAHTKPLGRGSPGRDRPRDPFSWSALTIARSTSEAVFSRSDDCRIIKNRYPQKKDSAMHRPPTAHLKRNGGRQQRGEGPGPARRWGSPETAGCPRRALREPSPVLFR
eukprot:scaffold2825_cov111-Isochrysis_galbana.AAC.4